ncbi:MAG: TolC family protein [Nitrospirota bacterium]
MKEKSKVQGFALRLSPKGSKLLKPFTVCLLLTAYCLLLITDAFGAEKLELTLKEAIDITLKENLSLIEERLTPQISEAEIKVEEGEFDPKLKLQVSESYQKSATPYIYYLREGREERTFMSEAGIEGKINTGATYELKWTNERFKGTSTFLSLNPYYTSDLTLTATQPLLKGLGKDIQESNLNVARNNLEISKLRLDDRASQIIADTTKAYWDLISARDELEVAELSLRLAKNLLDEAKARIEAGVLAPVEIYKAEAEVALREEALLRSRKLISDAEDRLRVTMNLREWHKEIVPVERPPEPSELPLVESALNTAISNRKDLRQARIEKRNKEILRKFYGNQQLPDLSIVGSTGLNGLNGNYSDTLDKLGSGDYYSWEVGVSLTIPIGNRTAKGNMLKAKYDEEKADISLKALEQKITAEVREAWRLLHLTSESITATKKTRIASEKRLEAEEGRFRVGMATMNDVLKFQEEYARSVSSEKKARTDYAKAIVEFERAKGTLGQSTPAVIPSEALNHLVQGEARNLLSNDEIASSLRSSQ